MPEQALGGIPLGFEIVVENKPFELSRMCMQPVKMSEQFQLEMSFRIN